MNQAPFDFTAEELNFRNRINDYVRANAGGPAIQLAVQLPNVVQVQEPRAAHPGSPTEEGAPYVADNDPDAIPTGGFPQEQED